MDSNYIAKQEKLAKAIWEYYYPEGGSVYKTFESLPNSDLVQLFEEVREIEKVLQGKALIIDRPSVWKQLGKTGF